MELVGLFSQDAQDIPQPLAPVRPIQSPVGSTVPFTTNTGLSASVDAAGNLWNEAGQYIGQMGVNGPVLAGMPTSGSTITTGGTSAPPPAAAPAAASGSSSSATTNYLAIIEKWLANLVTGGVSLEDIIFVVIGLMLLAAGVFSFRGTQTVIKTAAKTAGHAAELAA